MSLGKGRTSLVRTDLTARPFDGLADEVGEPPGEAGMLKRLDRPAQGFAVLDGDF
jgi:hypothetical protein